MKCNAAGIALIKHYEGCALTSYPDSAGIWTIGYGHTAGVFALQTISQARADAFLAEDIVQAERAVSSLIDPSVVLNGNEFSALVSFTFNLGLSALRRSTLLKKVNNCDYSAVEEFEKWVLCQGKVLPGLLARRKAEAALFVTPEEVPACSSPTR